MAYGNGKLVIVGAPNAGFTGYATVIDTSDIFNPTFVTIGGSAIPRAICYGGV